MKTNWIIEFDYDADPDDRIEDALSDQLSVTRGRVTIDGARICFADADDALRAKLRFANHVKSIERF